MGGHQPCKRLSVTVPRAWAVSQRFLPPPPIPRAPVTPTQSAKPSLGGGFSGSLGPEGKRATKARPVVPASQAPRTPAPRLSSQGGRLAWPAWGNSPAGAPLAD